MQKIKSYLEKEIKKGYIIPFLFFFIDYKVPREGDSFS